MFEHVPTYDKYRTLRLTTPQMHGEDIFALQEMLNSLGFTVDADGWFGAKTDKIVKQAQKALGITVDGLAGGQTQKSGVMAIAAAIDNAIDIPNEAMRGQLEHESGFRVGIYSPARPEGDFDAGVTQRNTRFHNIKDCFKPEPSIRSLAHSTRRHFELFEGVKPLRRRWALAQGAWNAPAFACFIAREEGATKVTKAMTLQPSSASRTTFEAYVSKVSQYLTV